MRDTPNRSRVWPGRNGFDRAAAEGGETVPAFNPEARFRNLALAALERERLERGRLARMLHDEVAQILSGVGLQLDIVRMDFEERIPEIAGRTAEIQELLERVVRHIRDLSYELNPDIVERAGLQPALDLLVGRFRKGFAGGLRLIYDSSVRIPSGAGVALERIAEEAVANAVRHAHCDQIEIIVKSSREGATLEVRDNGAGFDFAQQRLAPQGLGLLTMEYCAARAGLRLTVGGSTGQGSTVKAVFAGGKDDTTKQTKPRAK